MGNRLTVNKHLFCTVMRTKVKNVELFNVLTGEVKTVGTRTVNESCGTKLKTTIEKKTGVCIACYMGDNESPMNHYASEYDETSAKNAWILANYDESDNTFYKRG